MKVKILVIDDEEALCEILKFNLEKAGYDVDCAYSAEEALEMNLSEYSLYVVDIMMEQLSGYDFARRVRSNLSLDAKPIIFCTALSSEDDTVLGLDIGADDYITKPFVISEVLARVRAVLRRSQVSSQLANNMLYEAYESDITFQTLRIDRNEKMAILDGEDLGLTRTEYDLLLFFLTHRNRIYSREEIVNRVWDDNVVVTHRTIDTNIARLRKKIGPYGNNIVTRLGFGYGFKESI